ncbi:MAG: hypothetical protein MJ181_05760 [Treponema sp.]|nr:hypothetical protein [Treponema sp.]
MKKTFLFVTSVIALAVGLMVTSCKNPSEIDTVLYLSKPVVKATSYPGMNYVSWLPVANANGYLLTVVEDGNTKYQRSFDYDDALNYVDTDILDKAKYTYYVEAESKTSTGRSVVTENATGASSTVTGNVPAYNTLSLDLVNYEGSKGGNKEFVVAPNNIHVSRDVVGKFSISFPGKAYLEYTYGYSIDNEDGTTGKERFSGYSISDPTTNDKILYTANTSITSAGKHTFFVYAYAVNSHFGISPKVVSAETVTVKKLDVETEATMTSASYKDFGKTVRIIFAPAKLTSTANAPLDYYKMYRSTAAAPYDYTEVKGAINYTDSTKTALYVEDTVADNTVKYIYTLVTTDGTNYASTAPTKEVGIYKYADQDATTVSGSVTADDTDGAKNDIEWTITLPSAEVTIDGVYVLAKDVTDTDAVVAADFDTTAESIKLYALDDETGLKFVAYTPNMAVGKNVYMLVKTSQENKNPGEWISDAVETKAQETVTAATVSVSVYDNTLNDSTSASYTAVYDDVIVSVTDTIDVTSDSIENYSYTLYKTKSTIVEDIAAATLTFSASNDWSEGIALTLKDNTAYAPDETSRSYAVSYKENNLVDGVYAYKVVKTNKATGVSVISGIEYVTIDTKPSIAFTPSISAAWEPNPDSVAKCDITVRFVKDTMEEYVYDPDFNSFVIGTINEVPETGVTYTLYRAATVKSKTDVVYERVGTVDYMPVKDKVDVYVEDSGSYVVDTYDFEFTASLNYTKLDKELDTGCSYKYIVVASKTGCDNVYSNIVTVAGWN